MIDEMIDETFPASDPPQLIGRHAQRPARRIPSRRRATRPSRWRAARPPTIGNQGAIPASGVLEESVPLTDQGFVTLRFDGGHQRLHVYLGAEGLALDAQDARPASSRCCRPSGRR